MAEENPNDEEKLLGLEHTRTSTSLPRQLQEFEVIYDERPSSLNRYRQAIKSLWHKSLWPPSKWTIAAIVFDVFCAGYQVVDSYIDIYPGSEVAAHVLRNNSSWDAWYIFFWILAAIATFCNCSLLWRNWFKRFWALGTRIKFPWLIRLWRILLILFLCAALSGPFWITFVIRAVWKNSAWDAACSGWDVTAIVQGINYYNFRSNPSIIATATLSTATGPYFMQLIHQKFNYDQYTVQTFTGNSHFGHAISNLTYNTITDTFNGTNITTGSYVTSPSLAFPSLDLELRDPSIPFTRSNVNTYPPSADLIYRNGSTESSVLQTVMTMPGTCTTLKVCGTQDYLEDFQLALGLVMIEQFKVGVYCTVPSHTPVPSL
jgi:hypothetical protein